MTFLFFFKTYLLYFHLILFLHNFYFDNINYNLFVDKLSIFSFCYNLIKLM